MLEHCRGLWKKLTEPIARVCVRMHMSANGITITGSILSIALSIAIGITGWIIPLVFFLAIVVLFDSLDGSVAMLTTGERNSAHSLIQLLTESPIGRFSSAAS